MGAAALTHDARPSAAPPPAQAARRSSVVVRADYLGSTTNQIMVLSTFLPLVAGRFGCDCSAHSACASRALPPSDLTLPPPHRPLLARSLAPTSTRHAIGLKMQPADNAAGLGSADPAGFNAVDVLALGALGGWCGGGPQHCVWTDSIPRRSDRVAWGLTLGPVAVLQATSSVSGSCWASRCATREGGGWVGGVCVGNGVWLCSFEHVGVSCTPLSVLAPADLLVGPSLCCRALVSSNHLNCSNCARCLAGCPPS